MEEKVVITGYGMITEKGYEKTELWNSFISFIRDGIKASNSDYDYPVDYSKKYRGINNFAICGLYSFYLTFCEREEECINADYWGVFVGTAFGDQIQLSQEQCKIIREQGVQYILPGQNMNKGTQMVANICAIEHHFHGSNYTYTGGRSASAIAILEAFDEIIFGNLEGAGIIAVDNKEKGLEEIYTNNGNPISNNSGSLIIEPCNEKTLRNAIAYMYKPQYFFLMRDPNIYQNFEDNLSSALKYIYDNFSYSEIVMVVYDLASKDDENVFLRMTNQTILENKDLLMINISHLFGDGISAGTILGLGLGLISFEYGLADVKSLEKADTVLVITSDETGAVFVNTIGKVGQ